MERSALEEPLLLGGSHILEFRDALGVRARGGAWERGSMAEHGDGLVVAPGPGSVVGERD
jgi:hypothetical protein